MPKKSKGPSLLGEIVRTATSISRQHIGYTAGRKGESMNHAYSLMTKEQRDEYVKGHALGTASRLISGD